MPRAAVAAAAQPQGLGVSTGHLDPNTEISSRLDHSAAMAVVPSGVLGSLSGPVPHPQLEGGTPLSPARGAALQMFIQRHFPAPPSWSGWGPHTHARPRAGPRPCPAGCPHRGMTSWAHWDGGSGVSADRPTPRKGRLREGSGKPGQSHMEQGRAAAPAALGEPSQTSAPASGLCRAQGAVRKLEPGQPEHGGCQFESIPPRGCCWQPPAPPVRTTGSAVPSSTITVAEDSAQGVQGAGHKC